MASLSHNVSNFITLKLKPDNYPLWREQVLALAESQDLVGHLTGEIVEPISRTEKLTDSTSISDKLANEIVTWRKSD